MKRMMPILMALMIVSLANAQPPDTLWTRTFGGPRLERFHDVKCTPDGGYIAVGETWSLPGHDVDWYVVKTDSLGHLQWSQTFGGPYDDRAQAMVLTNDGGYVIAGHISGDTSRYEDGALVRLNAQGDSVWGHLYGGYSSDVIWAMGSTTDGGYVLGGFTGTYGSGGWDFWMLKTDSLGDSLWSHTFGGRIDEQGFAVQQTSDGGYAIGGSTASFSAGAYDMWLVKTNAQGDSLWSRTYGGGSFDEVRAMQQTMDSGFILVGYTGSFGQGWENAWLVKTDSLGNMEWNRAYGNVEQTYAMCVRQLGDGGYIVGGANSYGTGNIPNWLLRTNALGDSLWGCIWGSGRGDGIDALAVTPEGGYILAGHWDWDIQGITSGDACLIKTARDPLGAADRPRVLPRQYSLSAFPNPFNSQAIITYSTPSRTHLVLNVYDLLGRDVSTLQQGWADAGSHTVRFNAESLPSGIYFCHLNAGAQSLTRKLILLK
jgi:hypothetical protein